MPIVESTKDGCEFIFVKLNKDYINVLKGRNGQRPAKGSKQVLPSIYDLPGQEMKRKRWEHQSLLV